MLHWSGGESSLDERPFAVMNERAQAPFCAIIRTQFAGKGNCRWGEKRGEGREVGKLLHASFRLSLAFSSDF